LAEREKWKKSWREQKKLLTGIGLLMEGPGVDLTARVKKLAADASEAYRLFRI
jgi:hypothetical protein